MQEFTLAELKRQHKKLTKDIKKLSALPAFDSLEMKRLKTDRAKIKSEIVARGGTTSGMVRNAAALQRNKMEQITPVSQTAPAPPEMALVKKASPVNGSPGHSSTRYDAAPPSQMAAAR